MTELSLESLQAMLAKLEQQADAHDVGTMSDDDLAEFALNSRFSGHLIFSHTRGWYSWPDGTHSWHNDRRGDAVKSSIQTMLRDLRKSETDPRKSQSLGSRQRRDNVVEMLKGLPDVGDSGKWDGSLDLLATVNGVVNLRTGALTDGQPEQRITKAVNVAYDPNAECPRFERFLTEVFAHDPELPEYVQRLLGYGITGHVTEQCFAVLYGDGSNGKSVLLTVMRELLGEHAATVPFDMFTTSGKARGGPDAELLVGARLALASETNRSAVLDSAAIKNATGGEEITVNPKYRDPYAFKPQALILLATNYKPEVREQDHGTWRRVKLLPFLQKFEGASKDLELESTLRSEHAGILAWLVRGAMKWYSEGLRDPQSVVEAVKAYREESDPLAGFFPGVLEPSEGVQMTNAEIWSAYQYWAESEGVNPFKSSITLGRALRERDRTLVPFKSMGQRGMRGIRPVPVEPASGPGIFAM
ncbi:DNA primase family protein [Streptomyces mirabilis]